MTASKHAELPGLQEATLSGRGEVFSFTVMYNVPKGYEDQKPYVVALVKLGDRW